MRMKLKLLRTMNNLSQDEMAEKLNCCRSTYALIEAGKRNGSQIFWKNLQKEFDIPDDKMWELMQLDEER